MKPTFTTVDLFAGIGGFRMAIERNGGQTIAFSEINADAINAYIQNFSEKPSLNLGDITKITSLPHHDLLTAGVPCQSWSIAGRNLGFDDDRGQLWNDALFLLQKSQPKAFIFENVKGLADPRNKASLNYIMQRIKEAGYYADYYVLDSFDYGVPQSRVRIYIIGFRDLCFYNAFRLPRKTDTHVKLKDIIDDEVIYIAPSNNENEANNVLSVHKLFTAGVTSLSSNNNGYNDYFLLNDLRNGNTTIHSWDILETTERQKYICLLLLRNRRKKDYGLLDGNPLSASHFQSLDETVEVYELDELVSIGIFKKGKYAFDVLKDADDSLTLPEKMVLSKNKNGTIVADVLFCDRDIKINRIKVMETLELLENKRFVVCSEDRYEFRYTKISTGLFGVNRIFLPSSNIFPTLVASDSNDFISPISITAKTAECYRYNFMKHILVKKQYRKITKTEALRIQGFPDSFQLPDSRPRWMKLIGNSVAVPVIEKLVNSMMETGVFDNHTDGQPRARELSQENESRFMTFRSSPRTNHNQLTLFDI